MSGSRETDVYVRCCGLKRLDTTSAVSLRGSHPYAVMHGLVLPCGQSQIPACTGQREEIKLFEPFSATAGMKVTPTSECGAWIDINSPAEFILSADIKFSLRWRLGGNYYSPVKRKQTFAFASRGSEIRGFSARWRSQFNENQITACGCDWQEVKRSLICRRRIGRSEGCSRPT